MMLYHRCLWILSSFLTGALYYSQILKAFLYVTNQSLTRDKPLLLKDNTAWAVHAFIFRHQKHFKKCIPTITSILGFQDELANAAK